MLYDDFLAKKAQSDIYSGFDPVFMPDCAFDFQKYLIDWSVRKGRAANFDDCGLGKTLMQLSVGENIVRKKNKPVLLLTPLAVSQQTIAEGEKFGIEAFKADPNNIRTGINVTNYEQLHKFDPNNFIGVICDESSILKSFDGKTKQEITQFMRKVEFRGLYTATAAPNDYIEFGTSSEALGGLGYVDMLNKFFRNDLNNSAQGRAFGQQLKWRLKGHAERDFWRWICSWAKAVRRPSDIGFSDDKFVLPELHLNNHIVETGLDRAACTLKEQREEAKKTIEERCVKVWELVNDSNDYAIVWCHRNDEGDLLEHIIPDAIQVSGSDSPEAKEEKLLSFQKGQSRVLVTKPKIGAWGLNFQHCAHQTFFPSHSYEQFYQCIRRSLRFGQTRSVKVDIVCTNVELNVLDNVKRKSDQADQAFKNLITEMNNASKIDRSQYQPTKMEMPSWISK